MRIAVYNCYWNTRGGGERHAGAIAEILSRHDDVELVAHEPVDLAELSDVLGLDLSRTTYRQWPPMDARTVPNLSGEYDLFINSTFWSNLNSKAPKSAYLVFFPQHLATPNRLRLAGLGEALLQRWPGPAAEPIEGFYGPEAPGSPLLWTRGRALIRVPAQSFRSGRASLEFLPMKPRELNEALVEVRGEGIEWQVEGNTLILERTSNPVEAVDVEIHCRTQTPREMGISDDSRALGLRFETGQPKGRLRQPARRLARRLAGYRKQHDREFLSSYDVIMANSAYTQGWIQKRWGHPSQVLPPPVDTDAFVAPDPSHKKPVILCVGRFFAGAHSKKHPAMLRAFRRMCDRGLLPDGWEFHLAGNVRRSALADLEYYAEVERLSRGYPVKLLPDLPFKDLLEEYRNASVFWHATGWGESERRRPEKMEHFGLTTCEAMSSGCVPVVIAKAGQLEIVRDGVSGFLFSTEAELISRTQKIVAGYGQPWLLNMMATAAEDARRYNMQAFEKRLLGILEGL